MDEPTNHLDDESRIRLYRFITTAAAGILVVSHDRTLLLSLIHIYAHSKKTLPASALGGIYSTRLASFYPEGVCPEGADDLGGEGLPRCV